MDQISADCTVRIDPCGQPAVSLTVKDILQYAAITSWVEPGTLIVRAFTEQRLLPDDQLHRLFPVNVPASH